MKARVGFSFEADLFFQTVKIAEKFAASCLY